VDPLGNSMDKCSAWIGFDPRETAAFAVAKYSARKRSNRMLPIRGLVLDQMRDCGLYRREIQERRGPAGTKILWDPISNAPMSTQFAISRFLIPFLHKDGWALFMDSDVLVIGNLMRLFAELDPSKALYCVKHKEMPDVSGVKMDGQLQVPYRRKLWSSVAIWNCAHPANRRLTLAMVNTLPGRELHRFCWLEDDDIGELDPAWNHLVDIDPAPEAGPMIAHYTLGTPDMEGRGTCSYAEEWFAELAEWASSVC